MAEKEEKLRYTIGVKTISNAYQVRTKEFTRSQFDSYYDKVIAKGGKITGFNTTEI